MKRASLPLRAIHRLSDESLHRLYENIRTQVNVDIRSGSPHHFLGETAKRLADRLRAEMDRRRLRFDPIEW